MERTNHRQAMRIDANGRKLIERSEGRRNVAYRDTAGKWTTGIGHLIKANETHLITATLTDAEVDQLFAQDVAWAEAAAERLFPTIKRQNQFNALVSFVYNLGETQVRNGTLDDLIAQRAAPEVISAKWMQYNRSGGRVTPGLITRRSEELKEYWSHLWNLAAVLLVLGNLCMLFAIVTVIQ